MLWRRGPTRRMAGAAGRGGTAGRVITQNIDGLHTDAGLPAELVCEVHGTGRQFVCLACGERGPMGEAVARVEAGEEDPACLACGGIIKAATVSFGQGIPPAVWEPAEALTAGCNAFVAVGSSLVVQPAAGLPRRASRLGAKLVIVNREPTPLDDLADAVLHGEAGTCSRRWSTPRSGSHAGDGPAAGHPARAQLPAGLVAAAAAVTGVSSGWWKPPASRAGDP